MTKKKLTRREQEEKNLVSFINFYKNKSLDEINLSLLEIKHSNISSYEYLLKECLRNPSNSGLGSLASMKNILENLISADSKENIFYKSHLGKVNKLIKS